MFKKINLILIILLLSGIIYAQAPGMHRPGIGLFPGKWWKIPKIAERVALSQDQINKLEDIFLKYRKSMIDIQADIQKMTLDLDNLLDQEGVKDEVILKQSDSLIAARGELQRAFVRMMLEMKKVLTPEQVKKLKEIREELKARERFKQHKQEKERQEKEQE